MKSRIIMKSRITKGCLATAALVAAVLLGGGPPPAHAETAAARYSFATLYNSANAYARSGKPGMAVLNYERASLLAPGDPDVEANLLVVRRLAGLPAEPRSWLDRTVGSADPTLMSWIGVLGVALIVLGASTGLLRAPYRGMRRAAATVGVALIGLTAVDGALLWPKLHEAIVIVRAAPVHVSPAPMGEAPFALKEAEAVRISGEHEGFVLVRNAAGRRGWVWHTDLAPVVP
ncbi:MAG TPA: hypothetical protein VHY75_02265 [Steroidobacteraceae bacterium]|jgi:hypothetical protein|nr:hypothetical protein [Steroidobacteraceae bacterium]